MNFIPLKHRKIVQIKNKELELAKIKKEYDGEKAILEKNLSEIKFSNPEDKLRREMLTIL